MSNSFLRAMDTVLRGPAAPAEPLALAPDGTSTIPPISQPSPGTLIGLIVVMGAIFGAALGSYNGFSDGHALQIVFAAIKVPLFLLATLALTLPSFLVLNSLCGLRQDTGVVLHALLEQHAALSIILASFAPLTLFWYLSVLSYHGAVLFNLLMVLLACIASHRVLTRAYGPLLRRNSRHYLLMFFWQVLFIFVAIQMAWMLRPFIGVPRGPVVFLRHQDFGNAYDMIVTLLWRAANR